MFDCRRGMSQGKIKLQALSLGIMRLSGVARGQKGWAPQRRVFILRASVANPNVVVEQWQCECLRYMIEAIPKVRHADNCW